MAIKKSLTSFEEGLHRLRAVSDFSSLRDIIKEMLAICPPEKRHLAQGQIASILRKKQIEEIDRSAKDVASLQAVDAKYKNLYLVLKKLQMPGLQIPNGTTFPRTQLPISSKVSDLSGTELGLNMIKGWISSKKKLLVRGAIAAGALGAVAYLYKSYYGKEVKPTRKNPVDKEDKGLEQFEKTLNTMKRFKAFTEASRHGSWEDYEDLWKNADKPRRKVVKKVEDKDPDQDWDKWEKNLLKSMDEVSSTISSFERTGPPRLALDNYSPPSPKLSLTGGAELEAAKKLRKVSPQRRKRLPVVKLVEDSVEVEAPPAEKPIVKRTKRVKEA